MGYRTEARLIHVDVIHSPDLVGKHSDYFRTWVSMILLADNSGVVYGPSPVLKTRIFLDTRTRSGVKFDVILGYLIAKKMLTYTEVDGVSAYHVTNFRKYQNLKSREGKRSEVNGTEGEVKRTKRSDSEQDRATLRAAPEGASLRSEETKSAEGFRWPNDVEKYAKPNPEAIPEDQLRTMLDDAPFLKRILDPDPKANTTHAPAS